MRFKIHIIFLIFIFLGAMMKAQDSIQTLEIKDTQIPVIFERSDLVPTGFIKLSFIGGGSIHDDQNVGLASLGAKLLNEGTKSLGVIGFSEELDKRAISLSAYQGIDTLNIQLNFLKEKQTDALKLLSDLLTDPNLTQNTLDKIKQEGINKLLAKENDFDYLANNGLSKLLFDGTPLAQVPTKESIQAITLKDIQDYLSQNLTLSRLVIVLGGDMDEHLTLQALRPILAQLKVGQKSSTPHYESNNSNATSTIYKQTEQAYIYFGSPFDLTDLKTESYKAKILGFVLGSSGFGSRLMEEVRVKRGLAYSAYMKINTSKIINYASGYLQTKLESKDEAINIIRQVVANFVQNGITQEELDSAKQFLLGSEPLRSETIAQRLDRKFFNYYLGLPLDFSSKQLEQIKAISLEEINNYIKTHAELNDLSFSILTAPDAKKDDSPKKAFDSIQTKE